MDLDSVFSSDTEDDVAAETKASARVAEAKILKDQGNAAFSQGKTAEACALYKSSMSKIWALYRTRKHEEALTLGASLDLNLALGHIKMEEWEHAKRTASRALEVHPNNAKGLYRRGVAQARLGLLAGAESDLAAALVAQQDVATQKELENVRQRRATAGGDQAVVTKGFLQNSKREQLLAPAAGGELQGTVHACTEEAAREQDGVEEGEEASGRDVHNALGEVISFLQEISTRRVVCVSAGERRALLEQIELVDRLVPAARAAIDAAALESESIPTDLISGDCAVDVGKLLERMASGLHVFRPHFSMQERKEGEFDSIRVVRELVDVGAARGSGSRGFNLELLRWGDAEPASPDNFAEPLFPPTGKPPNSQAAAWQREAFHRICQKDVSQYASGAAWLLLSHFASQGVELHFRGRRVVDVGLAHGIFFAHPVAEGPEDPSATMKSSATLRSRADAFSMYQGADKRLIFFHSFTSFGVPHKWLLLRVAPADEQDPCLVDSKGTGVMHADLCAGALGLLENSPQLLRYWDAASDDRFIIRYERWGAAATELLAGPDQKRLAWQRLALVAMLQASSLRMEADDVIRDRSCIQSATPDKDEDCQARQESARRLIAAVGRLGLSTELQSVTAALERSSADDCAFDVVHSAAIGALVARKLRDAGLGKYAERAQEALQATKGQ